MQLEKTVDMMTSDDYKERTKAEYHQLVYRVNKLQTMVGKAKKEGKTKIDGTPIYVHMWQLGAMKDYLAALKVRIELEKIDL